MQDPHVTRPTLLLRIRDPDDVGAWSEFAQLYEPLLVRFAQQGGLQAADAADLTQEVLASVSTAIGRLDYDPRLGRFRGWLFTIARNKLRDFFNRRKRQPRGSGESAVRAVLENTPDDIDALQECWDQEFQKRMFEWASQRVQDKFQEATWQAFWQTAVEDRPVAEVAESLGLSVGAVYIAKSRVLARLKSEIQQHIGDE